MAAYKRSHNKKHMCVSCGEVRGKFHSHVISCMGASKESAGDLLSQEHARVESLRLARFSVQELKSEYGKTWPMHAYAYLKIGIPIKISDKKAVSSVQGLMSYFDTRELGAFVRTVDGVLTFQWKDASDATFQPQVSDNAIDLNAHVHSVNPPVLWQDRVRFAGPLENENQSRASPNISDHHNEIDNESNSQVKVTRKRKLSSLQSDTSTQSTVRMPDASPPLVTRSKAASNNATRTYVETEDFKTRRSKLKMTMVKKLNTVMPDSDTSISDSESESCTRSQSIVSSHKNASANKRRVTNQKMTEILRISKTALSDKLDCNEHVQNYVCYMKLWNYSIKRAETTGKYMFRIMQFLSDDNNPENFVPLNLLDRERRNDFNEGLKSVGLSSDTVGEYCHALTTMIQFERTNSKNSFDMRESFKLDAINRMYQHVCGSSATEHITPVRSYVSKPTETVSSATGNNTVPIRSEIPQPTPSTSQNIPSGHEGLLPGNSNRFGSPALSCSSGNSDTFRGTKAQSRRKFIDTFWPNMQAETETPSSCEYTRLVNENPRFGLGVTNKDRKNFQDAFLQLVIKKRAVKILDLVGRETLADPDSKFRSLLTQRNWLSKRSLSACKQMYEEIHVK